MLYHIQVSIIVECVRQAAIPPPPGESEVWVSHHGISLRVHVSCFADRPPADVGNDADTFATRRKDLESLPPNSSK